MKVIKENGEFNFQLPVSKSNIKFRLMTGLDVQTDRIEQNKDRLTE